MSDMAKKATATGIIYMLAVLIANPTLCTDAASNALRMCADVVVPSLFPFIFCGNMFVALGAAELLGKYLSRIMKPIFGVTGAGAAAFILGITSGYPVGAVCAANLYASGECTKTEAERLIAFCNNSGPMFVIGVVGAGILKSQRLGILLYLCHFFSAIICGMIFKYWKKDEITNSLPPSRLETDIKNAAPNIGAAVCKSVDTMLMICGFVVIFAVFCGGLPEISSKKFIYCFVEITGGLKALLENADISALPTAAFFLSLSGLSVLLQVTAVTSAVGLSVKSYIVGKVIQAVISFGLMLAAIHLTPVQIPVLSVFETQAYTAKYDLFAYSMIMLGCTAAASAAILLLARLLNRYIIKSLHKIRRGIRCNNIK